MMGMGERAGTFTYLARYALFQNSTAGLIYLNDIPGYVFKLTPKSILSTLCTRIFSVFSKREKEIMRDWESEKIRKRLK